MQMERPVAAQTELDSAGERSTKLECATARKIENKSSSMLSLRQRQNTSKRFKTAFKSPMRRDTSNSSNAGDGSGKSTTVTQDHIQELIARESQLDQQIQELHEMGLNEKELQVHIEKMHEYNEIKDVGQMLLGRIAMEEGVTTRSLYSRYGLQLDD